MDIVVKGRNVEVPAHYREHVERKLARLERYDRKTIRADVELFHERNPRQAKNCQRVEITMTGRGPAVRAEACSSDFYAALDAAASKLENRLRRMHDRRKVHYGKRNPVSVAEATADPVGQPVPDGAITPSPAAVPATAESGQPSDSGASAPATTGSPTAGSSTTGSPAGSPAADGGPAAGTPRGRTAVLEAPDVAAQRAAAMPAQRSAADDGQPGQIVREKEHTAKPMSVDQALSEMELVGHDFYLFSDADTGRPSVVYRRSGFAYGVIRLAD